MMLNTNFIAILLGNILLGAPLTMLILLGGLAGSALAPQTWLATGPVTAQLLVGVGVATPISLFMGRFGRRAGFLVGALLSIIGGLGGAAALTIGSYWLLCAAHAFLGAALITVQYFRFAAAEAVASRHQARAISFALASGLAAALLGREIYSHAKDLLAPTPLAGAYLAISIIGLVGAVPILGLRLSAPGAPPVGSRRSGAWRVLFSNPRILLAMGVAALSQGMMVLLMTPTPIAMIGCGFGDEQAADVIRWHVIAMFAPGFVTGSLIQRFGGERIAATGVALLLFSAGIAFAGIELAHFYWALIILGIGWNFGFVGGTHLLQAALTAEERPLAQGVNDTLLAASAAAASLLSGVLYAGIGWAGLAALSAPVLLCGCALLLWRARSLSRAATPASEAAR